MNDSNGHLVVTDVSLSFRRGDSVVEVLRSVSIEIKPHQIVVLLGPSGCGKSTLLNILAGFVAHESGTVVLDGQPIVGAGPERGVVFQNHSLFPWKTVLGNIEFGLRMKGVEKDQRREIAARVTKEVGLLGFENAYPSELSGGMAQRVGLARMLANDPKVMLMDEPFGSLDAQTRVQMRKLFISLWSQYKKSVLFVTHDIDEAILLADRIAIMSARPATIIEELPVPLPQPRSEKDLFRPEAIALRERLYGLLRQ
jgi:NitT/TauT family transport system ATP-binding protein